MRVLDFLRNIDIVGLLVKAVITLLAISVHEASHGLASYLMGDRTAKSMGRISINPLRHIDPIGALCLLFFGFGWAKPVMVNSYRFKNPKLGMSIVGLAGPLSNFIMALLGAIGIKIMSLCGAVEFFGTTHYICNGATAEFFFDFLWLFMMMNIGLGVFNLIPIPPLDGSKIFLSLLPTKLYYDIMRYEQIGWLLLVVALTLGVLDPVLGTANRYIVNAMFFLSGVPARI